MISGDSEHLVKFPTVVKTFLDRVEALWLDYVALESSDKAVKLFSNSTSPDAKAVLFGAVDKVCFSLM